MKKLLMLFLSVVILFSSCDSGIENNQGGGGSDEVTATATQKSELLTSVGSLITSEDIMNDLPSLPVDILNPLTQELVLAQSDIIDVITGAMGDYKDGYMTDGREYDLTLTTKSTSKASKVVTSNYKLIFNKLELTDTITSIPSIPVDEEGDPNLLGLLGYGTIGNNNYAGNINITITKDDEDLLNLAFEFDFDITFVNEENDEGIMEKSVDSIKLNTFKFEIDCAKCIEHNMALRINVDETKNINKTIGKQIGDYFKRSDKTNKDKATFVKDTIWSGSNSLYFEFQAYTIKDGKFTTYNFDYDELTDFIIDNNVIDLFKE